MKWTDPGGHVGEYDPCRRGCGGTIAPPPPPPVSGAGVAAAKAAVDAGTVAVGIVSAANPPTVARQTQVQETRWQERETDMGRRKVRRLRYLKKLTNGSAKAIPIEDVTAIMLMKMAISIVAMIIAVNSLLKVNWRTINESIIS